MSVWISSYCDIILPANIIETKSIWSNIRVIVLNMTMQNTVIIVEYILSYPNYDFSETVYPLSVEFWDRYRARITDDVIVWLDKGYGSNDLGFKTMWSGSYYHVIYWTYFAYVFSFLPIIIRLSETQMISTF